MISFNNTLRNKCIRTRCLARWKTAFQSRNFQQQNYDRSSKVVVIGSGNWGSVAARICGQNVLRNQSAYEFHHTVNMWVHDEDVYGSETEVEDTLRELHSSGNWNTEALLTSQIGKLLTKLEAQQVLNSFPCDMHADCKDDARKWWMRQGKHMFCKKLSNMINAHGENIKYLPFISLGNNVRAVPCLQEAVKDATLFVFVTPHQFIAPILSELNRLRDEYKIKTNGKSLWNEQDAKGISLVKGMEVTQDGFQLISTLISSELGMETCVLMGANIADEVGREMFSESTIGCSNEAMGALFLALFETPYFSVDVAFDREGVEMCGTLKNIVALGAGFCDGLVLGNNSKAAILRNGLLEMNHLAKTMFHTVRKDTFLSSAGVGDLVTTCYGGRNRRVAEAFVLSQGTKSFHDLELELLNGQKLQGLLTSHEVQHYLRSKRMERNFPLLYTIHLIATEQIEPCDLIRYKYIAATYVDQDSR